MYTVLDYKRRAEPNATARNAAVVVEEAECTRAGATAVVTTTTEPRVLGRHKVRVISIPARYFR